MDDANLPPMLSPKPWNADAVLRLMEWLLLAWGAANFLGFPVEYFCGSSLLQTNDLVDARSGTDAHPAPRILSGGSKVLGLGLLETRHLRVMGAVGATAAPLRAT